MLFLTLGFIVFLDRPCHFFHKHPIPLVLLSWSSPSFHYVVEFKVLQIIVVFQPGLPYSRCGLPWIYNTLRVWYIKLLKNFSWVTWNGYTYKHRAGVRSNYALLTKRLKRSTLIPPPLNFCPAYIFTLFSLLDSAFPNPFCILTAFFTYYSFISLLLSFISLGLRQSFSFLTPSIASWVVNVFLFRNLFSRVLCVIWDLGSVPSWGRILSLSFLFSTTPPSQVAQSYSMQIYISNSNIKNCILAACSIFC